MPEIKEGMMVLWKFKTDRNWSQMRVREIVNSRVVEMVEMRGNDNLGDFHFAWVALEDIDWEPLEERKEEDDHISSR